MKTASPKDPINLLCSKLKLLLPNKVADASLHFHFSQVFWYILRMPVHVSEHHGARLILYILKLELKEMPSLIGVSLF